MDACQIILYNFWQFDVHAKHNGKKRAYEFSWDNKKIILLSLKRGYHITKSSKEDGKLFLKVEEEEFAKDLGEVKRELTIISKQEVDKLIRVPDSLKPLLSKFHDLVPQKPPDCLPPMRDIRHHINLIHVVSFPIFPHYLMSP